LIVRAKITQRAGTLTEQPPVVDPDGTAMDRLGAPTACQGGPLKARCQPEIVTQEWILAPPPPAFSPRMDPQRHLPATTRNPATSGTDAAPPLA